MAPPQKPRNCRCVDCFVAREIFRQFPFSQEAATKRSAQASQARRKLHVKAVTQARSARGVCVLDVEGREAPGPRTCPVCPPSAPAARAATERKLPRRRRGNAPPGAARPGAPQAPADDPPPDVAVFLQMLEAAEADPPVEYVYDYYYIDEEMTAEAEDSEDMAVVEIGDEFQMLLEEAPELMVPKLPAWEEDVDSNASDNPNNDYPDTESESEYIEQEVGYGLGSGYYAEPDYDAAWGDDEGAYESYRPEAARAPHDGFAEYLLRQAEVGGTRTLHRGHEAMVRDYVSAMET